MSKINKLTPEQEAELPRFRQRYLDIACSGGRIDRPALESAMADAYAVIGKPAPRLFIFDSPAACMLALKIFRLPKEDQLGDQKIYDPHFLWGSQDLCWIAWARFAEHIGVKLEPRTAAHLDIMECISTQCEWWWPCEGVVIASERPTRIRWDEQRRLHCEDGPAVRYADGYSLYAWHRTRLPESWVEQRETIDPREILKERNVETRAAGAACIGWPRMLSALDYKVVDADPDPSHGELIEVRLDGLPEPGRFLKAECPRNGTIVEGVPREISTVLAAQAWRVGLDPHEFSYPTVRT